MGASGGRQAQYAASKKVQPCWIWHARRPSSNGCGGQEEDQFVPQHEVQSHHGGAKSSGTSSKEGNFGNGHGRGGRRPSNGPQNVRYIPMDSPMMMMQPVMVAPPRRFSAISAGHAELAVSGLGLPPNVIRMPRGPAKGEGFKRWYNSRMKPEGAAAAPPAAPTPVASAPVPAPVQQKQQQPLPQRKSRAIPIVAPPEAAGAAEAAAGAPEPAAPVVDRNLVVNLDSSDPDEGHFSDHDLADENERT